MECNIIFLMGVLIGVLFTALVVLTAAIDVGLAHKQAAVDRGYALYCPNNGEWAWIGECKGNDNAE